MNSSEKQRGVALLFALGILSLILVMGVAFLGNALISQKIAVNNERSDFSRSLARSAADRALAHLMMFHLVQSKYALWDAYKKDDAYTVYSRKTGSGNDMLTGDDSKLNVETKLNKPWYKGSDNGSVTWIYVHEDGTESNGAGGSGITSPIIGRFAYQVLPAGLRIPLYAMTAGASSAAAVTEKDEIDGFPFRVPKLFRWGMDIDELVIPRSSAADDLFHSCWGPSSSSVYSRQHEYDNFFGLLSGGGSATPLSSSRNKADVENLKRWSRNVFAEGRERLAPEAYTDNTLTTKGDRTWYPRFNLSDFTPFKIAAGAEGWSDALWYSRFLDSEPANAAAEKTAVDDLKNKPVVLDRLAPPGSSEIFQEGNSRDRDYDNPIGLPFLKRIGGDAGKGAFDTVENFRKQIAANLNDYCDSDSIPTSDVAASTWGGLSDNSLSTTVPPSYTGNEKTLYINEIAFGFKLDDAKLSTDGGGLSFKLRGAGDKLKTELIAELVGVYKDLPDSYDSLRLKGRLHSLKAKIRVSIKGKVNVHYTVSGTPHSDPVDFLSSGIPVEKLIKLTEAQDIDINAFKKTAGNYWLGRIDLTESMESDVTFDLKNDIASRSSAGSNPVTGITIDTIDEIKVELLEVTFDLGNLALYVKHAADAANPAVDSWVDFVRVNKGDRSTGGTLTVLALSKTAASASDWYVSKLADETASEKGFFYGGSMQAIDPRQNLWAKLENTTDNDWVSEFTPSLADVTSSGGTPNWDSLDNRKTGKKNVNSNPSAPNYADGSDINEDRRDKETATDPAWLGNEHGQHISTAVIRNKPMRSPWELGFIHRAAPFQTINLKKAGGLDGTAELADTAHKPDNFSDWTTPEGTAYEHGDAGILDQIKMTEYNRSYGKLDFKDLRQLDTATSKWWIEGGTLVRANLNRFLFRGLFEGIKRQDAAAFLEESGKNGSKNCHYYFEGDNSPVGDPLTNPVTDSFTVNITTIPDLALRSKVLNDAVMKGLFVSGANDAAQEEIVGKTFNLIESHKTFNLIESQGYPELPRVFRVVIVAQAVGDGTGPGTFAAEDGILSECRMLVTVERVSYIEKKLEGSEEKEYPRVRLRIRQIEYLD